MAHQFLKFKIDLNDNKNFQPVLGSQDYGTFYMVYIKIKKYKSFTNEDGFEQHNYTCDFKLQNFIGDITIGFADNAPEIKFPNSNPKDPIDASLNIKIAPFMVNPFIKDRVLELDKKLDKGFILETNFERKIPRPALYDSNKPNNSEYLSPYSFIRDGEDYLEIATRKFGTNDTFKPRKSMAGDGGFCVPNRSLII